MSRLRGWATTLRRLSEGLPQGHPAQVDAHISKGSPSLNSRWVWPTGFRFLKLGRIAAHRILRSAQPSTARLAICLPTAGDDSLFHVSKSTQSQNCVWQQARRVRNLVPVLVHVALVLWCLPVQRCAKSYVL